ncbi:HBR392Cp [Eremothecium sinecaudum]|uniref:Cytochrome c oxidase assembly factor 3 n=1 Tax=Eremothecium sinecaudum TaxID=45286 RepID=A0A109UXE0_9SACH|nr:HBR392Cp [Eremothecium sinecaudum]AMD19293.1 HBR392Cp [Eremothecium sinecaudum]
MFKPNPYQDPRTGKMTPAMIRARQPYFKKNMISLVVLLGLVGGIYTYTYRFLHKDDDFRDVPIPPIDEKELQKLKMEYMNEKKRREESQK